MKPQSWKFSKAQKGRVSPLFFTKQTLNFGQYGILALQPIRLKNSTISAVEFALKRILKPHGRLWIRIYPHFPVTSKPTEVRMGKGKGAISYWMASIRPGIILFEFSCSSFILAQKIHKLVNSKLPIKTILISK